MIYFIGNETILNEDSIYKQSSVLECLEYFKNHEFIGIDTETQGRDPHIKKILSLQIGDSSNQFVIDCRTISILKFKELLESKICLAHNAKFDYKFLKHAGIVIENWYDTMLAECVLYCGYEHFGYSLKDVCQRYLNVTLNKDTRGDFFKLESQPFNSVQIEYAAKDVEFLHQIKNLQQILIDKYDLNYCVNLENNTLKALADIEYNGMYLNKDKWLNNCKEYQTKLHDIFNKLDIIILNDPLLKPVYKPMYIQTDLFGEIKRELNINYSSPLQISKICKVLGFDIDSTNDRELSKLVNSHEFFKLMQEYREYAKIISTYGEGFLNYINCSTKKVHTDFWQVLSTGRVSSGSKTMNSPNLQNIPAKNSFRNCFEARKGFKWVSIDYSGQELRLMADGSGENGFIDVLNKGDDLHCYVGSMMYKRTIDPIKDKSIRTKVKSLNFGL